MLMRPQDAVIDPVFHEEDPPSKGNEHSPENALMLKSMLLLEVFEHGFGESTDEKRKYLFEGDHFLS